MKLTEVLIQLRRERDQLDDTISALERLATNRRRGPGRPPGRRPGSVPAGVTRPGRRRISAATRKAMSEARKAWWASRRKAG